MDRVPTHEAQISSRALSILLNPSRLHPNYLMRLTSRHSPVLCTVCSLVRSNVGTEAVALPADMSRLESKRRLLDSVRPISRRSILYSSRAQKKRIGRAHLACLPPQTHPTHACPPSLTHTHSLTHTRPASSEHASRFLVSVVPLVWASVYPIYPSGQPASQPAIPAIPAIHPYTWRNPTVRAKRGSGSSRRVGFAPLFSPLE